MNTCATCFYWEPPNGNGEAGLGECQLIGPRVGKMRPINTARIEASVGDHAMPLLAVLKTAPEFGCTEWEGFNRDQD